MEKIRRKLIAIMLLLLVSLSITAQEINVSGTVVDTTGEPVIGATVMQKGSTNGTVTDIEGNFKIAVNSGATLVVTYIGYVTQEVAAADGMRVVIKEDAQGLQEVVVTGYTTQRKSDLTGAVSVVDVDELQKQNENNPIKALQGRVPGMNISADGSPSGAATVRIRGVGTLNDNDPLYIIDGVPTKSGMHELNGNDIESIQVLKDAASASIYGSRAANGVIIITTKKGKNGQVRITLMPVWPSRCMLTAWMCSMQRSGAGLSGRLMSTTGLTQTTIRLATISTGHTMPMECPSSMASPCRSILTPPTPSQHQTLTG